MLRTTTVLFIALVALLFLPIASLGQAEPAEALSEFPPGGHGGFSGIPEGP
jgi:hypothetical protein